MRITNPQITAMMYNSMSANSAELGKLMQQMATGKRLMQPSDDPIASVRALRVQREEASLEQYAKNISTVSSSLSSQEVNLTSTSDSMLSMRDLLLWAANGTNTSEDLSAMAGEMSIITDTLLSFANVRDEEGRYLFSGTFSDKQAVVFDQASQSYVVQGNDKHRQAAVANGVLVEENVTALSIYGANAQMFNDLSKLVETLQAPGLDVTDPAVRAQIVSTLESLDTAHGRVMTSVTELGGRQNALSLLKNSNEDLSLINGKIQGELLDLDYAQASIDLNNYQLALGASQKTYLKINEMSLFAML